MPQASEIYPRGTVVLVPFPFTDLSGRKRRPALVVSPGRFHDEDLILCAITSRVPERLSAWEVPLAAGDMAEEELPRTSIIKVSKLFTMHKKLVAARYGTVKEQKLQNVLERLRSLFAREGATNGAEVEGVAEVAGVESGEIDEAVLALLWLNAFADQGATRAWKTFDWDAMDRLYERGLISDPKSKAKSVVLTEEGQRAAEEAFRRRLSAS
jgi:mRNA-degrading endonuclease toxin of MazEF toxin-antitoxin module